jgi:hypothetical protein
MYVIPLSNLQVRPQNMGLGHKGFDERTDAVKQQATMKKSSSSADVFIDSLPDDSHNFESNPTGSYNGTGKEYAPGWKRSTQRKKHKMTYKHAVEITDGNIAQHPAPSRSKIIDMTGSNGPQSLDAIPTSFNTMHKRGGRLSEFRHNVQEIRLHVESELQKAARNEVESRHYVTHCQYTTRITQERIDAASDDLGEIEIAMDLARQIKAEPSQGMSAFLVNHGDKLARICECRLEQSQVADLVASILAPYIQRYLAESPVDTHLPALLAPYRSTLIHIDQPDVMTAWESILTAHVIPRLQSFIANKVHFSNLISGTRFRRYKQFPAGMERLDP